MVREPGTAARPFDYVFLLRPTALVPLWTFLLYGASVAGSGRAWPRVCSVARTPWLGLLAMTLILGGGYILNQITDVETDRRNDKLFLLPRGIITARAAWTELAVVWAGAGAILVLLPPAFRWVALASTALALTYSAPPIRAKARAPLDLLWNGLGFGALGAAAGWTAVATPDPHLLARAAGYVLAVAGVIASTTIPDTDGDSSVGLRTTSAVLGATRTSALALALVAAAAAVGWYARDPLALGGSALSLPLLLRAHATGARRDRILANQVAVAAFACVAALWAPWLLLLLGGVLAGSRAYYGRRFGVTYPGPGTP